MKLLTFRHRLAMYYNGYIMICIFLGAYLGGFIFQWETLGALVTPFLVNSSDTNFFLTIALQWTPDYGCSGGDCVLWLVDWAYL